MSRRLVPKAMSKFVNSLHFWREFQVGWVSRVIFPSDWEPTFTTGGKTDDTDSTTSAPSPPQRFYTSGVCFSAHFERDTVLPRSRPNCARTVSPARICSRTRHPVWLDVIASGVSSARRGDKDRSFTLAPHPPRLGRRTKCLSCAIFYMMVVRSRRTTTTNLIQISLHISPNPLNMAVKV